MITITANRTGNPGTITEVLRQAIGFGPNLTDLAACRQYVAPPYGPPFLHAQAGTVKRLALVQRKPGTQAEINQIALARIVFFVYVRSEEHTSELQSLMRISYAVFCLKNKKTY